MADAKINILLSLEDKASSKLSAFSSKLKGFGSKVVGVATKSLLAFGAATVAAGGAALKTASNLEQERQGFITLLGSAEEADKAIEQIKIDAAATPFELPGLITANKLLTTVTKDAARSESFLLDIGKALAAAGKGQPELDRIIVNLQQIGSVGKASMLDIKQFAFAGIPIFDLLTEATGKTGEELGDMISNGEISFDLLEQTFKNAGAAGGQFADAFKNQMGTANQMVSNLKDTLVIMGDEIVRDTGIFDAFKGMLSGVLSFLSENTDVIKDKITGVIDSVKEIYNYVIDNVLKPLAEGFLETFDMDQAQENFASFKNFIKDSGPDLLEIFTNLGESLGTMVTSLGNLFKLAEEAGALNGLVDIFRVLAEAANLFSDGVSSIVDELSFLGTEDSGISFNLPSKESKNIPESSSLIGATNNDTNSSSNQGNTYNFNGDIMGVNGDIVNRAIQEELNTMIKYNG